MITLLNIYSRTPGSVRFEKSVEKYRHGLEWEKVITSPYPGNIKRWEFMPKGLTGTVIFTDTDDVIMQRVVPDLHTIITAPENVLHKDSYWKPFCVGKYEVLLDKPVYNAGMMYMPAEEMYELAKFILESDGNDQLSYNLWLLGKPHKEDISIFLPLYDNMKNAKKIGDKWVIDEVIPAFVHANGNNKDKL